MYKPSQSTAFRPFWIMEV